MAASVTTTNTTGRASLRLSCTQILKACLWRQVVQWLVNAMLVSRTPVRIHGDHHLCFMTDWYLGIIAFVIIDALANFSL